MAKILILGAGSIGKRHLKNILGHQIPAENVFVVEPRADRQEEVVGIGISKDNIFADRDTALANGSYDGAIIATPTSMHYDDALPIAKAGIHFMLEKPVGIDLQGYDELISAIESNKLFAFTAYCFRFDPVAREFAKQVHDQTVGAPLYARAEMSTYLPEWHPHEDYRDFYMSKKELGGGTLLDQSHLFDMTRWFLGDIEGLTGISTKYSDLEIDTDDFGEMIFKMKSGVYASVHIDLYTKVWREFYQITCQDGTVEWDINKRKLYLTKHGQEQECILEGKDYNQMYIDESAYFLKGVTEGPSVDGPKMDDGKKAMDVVCAVRESNGHSFISLP